MEVPSLAVETIIETLSAVQDPELGVSIVELGMVDRESISCSPGGHIQIKVALTIAGCPLRSRIENEIKAAVGRLPGVASVDVDTSNPMDSKRRRAAVERARLERARSRTPSSRVAPSTRVIAVASGKGGVGKSSVSAALAVAMACRGLSVGLLDADIWGFSIPRLLHMTEGLVPEGTREAWTIRPSECRVGSGLLRVVSMGMLAANEDEAIMWRGMMLARALQHFAEDVSWGELHYLLVDMPPGTGDVHMGLSRWLPQSEVLIITTPPRGAAQVAARAADMARKGFHRVIGVVENMSGFVCRHGERYTLFGEGGGQILADRLGVPLLAKLPLDPELSQGPFPSTRLEEGLQAGPFGKAVVELAERMITEVVPPLDLNTCSAHQLATTEGIQRDTTEGVRM